MHEEGVTNTLVYLTEQGTPVLLGKGGGGQEYSIGVYKSGDGKQFLTQTITTPDRGEVWSLIITRPIKVAEIEDPFYRLDIIRILGEISSLDPEELDEDTLRPATPDHIIPLLAELKGTSVEG